jgi:hypothetical protein
MEVELKAILEPDYGLPYELVFKKVLTQEQRNIVNEATPVESRVFHLLQAVKQNFGSLNDACFLKVLTQDRQKHVAKFIEVNGNVDNITEDTNRPLNEQQRRRLLDRSLQKDMNSRNTDLLDMIVSKNVISLRQQRTTECTRKQRRTAMNSY